ncbi:SH3 domain-binding protein 2 [Dunckerocampus dactyliophorus]|uniref:SH3 domain-binding protein 2 n=1 Tax=Dunckerocampus dactyliophorus TaxID=161453 RepID=UPI002405C7A6|nr:SH3 domain-binding protein 2 [Dunckerocampus dactyliophorus]
MGNGKCAGQRGIDRLHQQSIRKTSERKREKRVNQKAASGGFGMELLPALASTVSLLKNSDAVRCMKRKFDRRTMSSREVCWPVPMRAIGAQNLLTMPGGVTIAGYLHKKGGSQFSLLRWPLRYVIILKGCVYYFKSSTSAAPQGAFSLNGYNRVMRAAEETTSNNVFPFKIIHVSKKHRTWLFSAASEDERRSWMRSLRCEIDRYNDRKESHLPSDSDSDADSFYGTIERPLDIKDPMNNAENDFCDDDDDEDDEDYLKPDSECLPTCTGRPTGPPPAYPPPPVPMMSQRHIEFCPSIHKGTPPPVPSHNRTQTNRKRPLPLKPPPIPKDLNKGPPPPPPFVPHLRKPSSDIPPPLPPPNTQRPIKSTAQSVARTETNRKDWKSPTAIVLQSPTTLPICERLETRMVLDGSDHCSPNAGSNRSISNNHLGAPVSNLHSRPSLSAPHAASCEGRTSKSRKSYPQTPSSHPPLPFDPPRSPLLQTGLQNKSMDIPKAPPGVKPPLPVTKPRQSGTPLQRAAPEGQSFRSPGGESMEFKKKQDLTKSRGDISDGDYDNMLLPDSVFIDTTETSIVEKLFKECSNFPQDGLYGIRNSGTKTSKVLVVWDVGIGKARNYRLFEEGDRVFLDTDKTFSSLSSMVEHYYSHPLPHHGSLCLQIPYS